MGHPPQCRLRLSPAGPDRLVPARILCVSVPAPAFHFLPPPDHPLTLVFLLSAAIDAIERPFTPDGAKDLGSVWARQAGGQVLPNARRLAKPNAMMFFHIPL